MNFLQNDFETMEEGMQKLKDAVSLRNQMGGVLYWNMLNDDCLKIAEKLIGMGADQQELSKIIKT